VDHRGPFFGGPPRRDGSRPCGRSAASKSLPIAFRSQQLVSEPASISSQGISTLQSSLSGFTLSDDLLWEVKVPNWLTGQTPTPSAAFKRCGSARPGSVEASLFVRLPVVCSTPRCPLRRGTRHRASCLHWPTWVSANTWHTLLSRSALAIVDFLPSSGSISARGKTTKPVHGRATRKCMRPAGTQPYANGFPSASYTGSMTSRCRIGCRIVCQLQCGQAGNARLQRTSPRQHGRFGHRLHG